MVTINELAAIVMEIAGKRACGSCTLTDPRACAVATPTTRRLREVLGWEPTTSLEEGLAETYRWIEKQVAPGA